MTDSDLPMKKCPECGESLKGDASLCRFCGYVFPIGRKGKVSSETVGSPDSGRKQPTSALPDWMRLAMPLFVVFAVGAALVVLVMTRSRSTALSWPDAISQYHPRSSHDAEFESLTSPSTVPGSPPFEVRVFDGLCYVNVHAPSHGLLTKFAARKAGEAIGQTYSAFRQINGEDAQVVVEVYLEGRPLGSRTVNGKQSR
jgi:hypothetical protein